MKPFQDMTEPELRRLFDGIARMVVNRLPPGTLFTLVAWPPDMIGHYVSNARRVDVIKALREFADKLEAREDVPRAGGPPLEDEP